MIITSYAIGLAGPMRSLNALNSIDNKNAFQDAVAATRWQYRGLCDVTSCLVPCSFQGVYDATSCLAPCSFQGGLPPEGVSFQGVYPRL